VPPPKLDASNIYSRRPHDVKRCRAAICNVLIVGTRVMPDHSPDRRSPVRKPAGLGAGSPPVVMTFPESRSDTYCLNASLAASLVPRSFMQVLTVEL
jgi:hypothetical protein